jgi:hypothetical protein
MDTILKVIVLLASAWLAYIVARGERSGRALSPSAIVGVFLMLFGGIAFGLLRVESFFAPKLIDFKNARFVSDGLTAMITDASDTDLLVGGLIVLAGLVVLSLDLLGKVDVMSKLDSAIGNAAHRPSSPSGD